MNRASSAWVRGALLVVAIAACSCVTGAGIDPTRPQPDVRTSARAGSGAGNDSAPGVVAQLRLEGIWSRAGERVAMLDGVRAKVGDFVSEQHVVAIDAGGVQLRAADGSVRRLELSPIVRRRATELQPAAEAELAVRR